MANRELKRMSREELLGMLIERGKENEALLEQLHSTEERLNAAEEQLRSMEEQLNTAEEQLRSTEEQLYSTERELAQRSSMPETDAEQPMGSLADAAVRACGVMEAAQRAADQYLEGAARRRASQEAECAKLEAESRARAEALMAETIRKCKALEQEAEQAAAEKWRSTMKKMDALYARISDLSSVFDGNETMEI
ncbi:MAG: hypothetical protein ACI4MF_03150 [Candidatus Faecivicinus sp.]